MKRSQINQFGQIVTEPRKKLRFVLQENAGGPYLSDRWSAWVNHYDLYLAASGLGGAVKLSLHGSGVCQWAITSQLASHQPPYPKSGRTISRWNRAPFNGITHTQAVSLQFIQVSGWQSRSQTGKKAIGLYPPPLGGLREVAVFYSETDPLSWLDPIWLNSNILASWKLDEEMYVTIRTRMARLPAPKLDHLLDLVEELPAQMFVGEEDVERMPTDCFSCMVSEATDHTGYLYSLEGIPAFGFGRKASWSTKTGNKFAPKP